MAKRNLARTAIEGGRAASNRYEEHIVDRKLRQAARIALHRCIYDEEYRDEFVVEAYGDIWGRDFKDKLSPVKRWLAAQVGRCWDDVYSEIRRTFDFRSTPGRHIVDHICGPFGYVDVRGRRLIYEHWPFWRWTGDFYLDRNRVLRMV